MTVVTGVSGSGKSSLVHHVLHGRLMESRGQRPSHNLGPAAVFGDDFDEVVLVDQGSIPRSSRSNALTFSGAYTPVRELFADVGLAKLRGYTPGTYSFNTKGGRCERCEGTGIVTIEMHFIADVELTCDVCHGRRFRDEVLEITVDGRSIADVFDMTIDEAVTFFADRRPIHRRLEPLKTVGLGYLRLGQTTSKMSGGELQRLKMASYVGRQSTSKGHKLFLFDEPTIGLHLRDVEQLVAAMRQLTTAGHTVVVVEHNLDLVAASDWVVDLGPGAGPDGGHVVYEGPVAGLLTETASVTGRFLGSSLANSPA
jgi:excinuclease ABC subunit A